MIEKYILSIVVFAIFALMLMIWLCTFVYNKNRDIKRRNRIEDMYNDESLAKMEYDFAVYDDNTERMISQSSTESQLTIDDVLIDSAVTPVDEGMEEITGNYKPR